MDSTKTGLEAGPREADHLKDTASDVLSAEIDRAAEQLDACTDEPCRRAWRAVLDGLEEMLPVGVGETVR